MEIEKSVRFVTDPVVTEFVNRVGQNLVKNSDAKVPFTIKVIDSTIRSERHGPAGRLHVRQQWLAILTADDEAETGRRHRP